MTHRASTRFWRCYRALPTDVRRLADRCFELLKADSGHRSLHFKKVNDFRSVRVGLHYRALAIDDAGDTVWFWMLLPSRQTSLTSRTPSPRRIGIPTCCTLCVLGTWSRMVRARRSRASWHVPERRLDSTLSIQGWTLPAARTRLPARSNRWRSCCGCRARRDRSRFGRRSARSLPDIGSARSSCVSRIWRLRTSCRRDKVVCGRPRSDRRSGRQDSAAGRSRARAAADTGSSRPTQTRAVLRCEHWNP